MKTIVNKFTGYGNIGLVQISCLPETSFMFKAGGPEMKSGGLVITEVTENGNVGKLTALNNTDSYLLLTDSDVLTGAKQNRIINKSVLLAPFSKTSIDVSCVERLRWQYTGKTFSSGTSADHDLRKAKAASMSTRHNTGGESYMTQSNVWSHINMSFSEEKLFTVTESYNDLAAHHMRSRESEFPVCEAEAGCNGIAVVSEGKVQCMDLFGAEDVYKYYFPLLRDSAFRIAATGKKIQPVDMHEANFKVLDALDRLEPVERTADKSYTAAGNMNIVEQDDLIGFELMSEGVLVHKAVFTNK